MENLGIKTLADFADVGAAEVESHLTDLAVDGNVAPSTQNQAFCALLFLFKHVLKRNFDENNTFRSTKGARIPTVMSKSEVIRVLSFLTGIYSLIGELLYGCGHRLPWMEARAKLIWIRSRIVIWIMPWFSEIWEPDFSATFLFAV